MAAVVSPGSVNVDRIYRSTDAHLDELAARYDWSPTRGQTVIRSSLPDGFATEADLVRHGGKGANQAVAAAAAGADTAFLGAVGGDASTAGVLDALESADVDVSDVATVETPTGAAFVFVEAAGEDRIVVRPGANSRVDETYVTRHVETIRDADALLLQNEIPVEPVRTLLDALADAPDPPAVILDPAPATGVAPLLACEAVTHLTPNEIEYEAIQDGLDGFEGTLIRKRGAADVIVTNDQSFTVTPPAVDAVDSTGSGDVFNGYLAARLVAGDALQDAIETATVAGALSVRAEGARGSVPSLAAVRAFNRR
jgi:ribokinase